MTETKFTPERVTEAEGTIPGYAPHIRRDRTAQGGGVAIWIKSGVAFQRLLNINCYNHEVIWVSLLAANNVKVVICAVYRSGSSTGTDVELFEWSG